MFGKIARPIAIASFAVVVALTIPIAARATGPVITHDDDTTPQTIDEWGDCSTFQIDATFMAQRRNEDFFDASGNLVLERRHVDFSGTLYNASDPSHALTYSGSFTRTLDPIAGTLTMNGLLGHVIVPGEGVIELAAGTLSIDFATGDVVARGPDGDLTALCAALA